MSLNVLRWVPPGGRLSELKSSFNSTYKKLKSQSAKTTDGEPAGGEKGENENSCGEIYYKLPDPAKEKIKESENTKEANKNREKRKISV